MMYHACGLTLNPGILGTLRQPNAGSKIANLGASPNDPPPKSRPGECCTFWPAGQDFDRLHGARPDISRMPGRLPRRKLLKQGMVPEILVGKVGKCRENARRKSRIVSGLVYKRSA